MEGLQEADDTDTDGFMANPGNDGLERVTPLRKLTTRNLVLPEDILKEAIPGNIRKAEHFVAFLKRFVEYLKVCFYQAIIQGHS